MKNKYEVTIELDHNTLQKNTLRYLKQDLYQIQEENDNIESIFYHEDRTRKLLTITCIYIGDNAEEDVRNIVTRLDNPGVTIKPDTLTVTPYTKRNWLDNTTPKRVITITLIGTIIAMLTAVFTVFFIEPRIEHDKNVNILEHVENQRGNITPVNIEAVVYMGEKIENANIHQRGLGVGETPTTPASYIFDNGKTGEKKTVEIFLDFTNQKSRDFLLFHRESLRGMIEGGVIQLRILPVPTGKTYTVYASEALAEAFILYPEKAWDFLFELAMLYPNTDNSTSETIAESISELADKMGMSEINTESLTNGTFASWIISIGKDPRLKTGYYPPLVYVNNTLLDLPNTNDVETLHKLITRG